MLKPTESRVPPEIPGSLPPGTNEVWSAAPQVLVQSLLLVPTKQTGTSDGRSPGFRQEARDEVQKLSRQVARRVKAERLLMLWWNDFKFYYSCARLSLVFY